MLVVACFVVALLTPASLSAQEATQPLEGAWTIEKVETDEGVDESPQPALILFVDGHYATSAVVADSARTFADPDSLSGEEKIQAFAGYAGSAGTYEVQGDSLVTNSYVTKDPRDMTDWPHNVSTRGIRVEGNVAYIDLGDAVLTLRRVSEEAPLQR